MLIRSLLLALVNVAMLGAAVYFAGIQYEDIDLIPRWLLRFGGVTLTTADLVHTAQVFAAFAIPIFLAGGLIMRKRPLSDAVRMANDICCYGLAASLTAVVMFGLTVRSFTPNYFALAVVGALLLRLALHLVLVVMDGRNPFTGVVELVKALFGRLLRPIGIITVIVGLSPAVLAVSYMANRDVANAVNMTKRYLTSVSKDLNWALVPVFTEIEMRQPIDLEYAPGSASEVYILEREGRLYRHTVGTDEKTLLLDLADDVRDVGAENGAVGMALHPKFNTPGHVGEHKVFIYHTRMVPGDDGKPTQVNRLVRFDLSGDSVETRTASRVQLIEQQRWADGLHNGGAIEFGDDGFLYLSVGEGSTRTSHQQLDQGLLGGVMRLDVDMRGGSVSHPPPRQPVDGETGNYYIPSDNPFVGNDGVLEEFWALGLRNSYRMAFDPETGLLWGGEVGGTLHEEVNIIRAGGNYQYPYIEGVEDMPPERPAQPHGTEVPPIYHYPHNALDRAIIGGVVYRGERYAELDGQYLFADNYSGRVWTLDAASDGTAEPVEITQAQQLGQLGIAHIAQVPGEHVLFIALGAKDKSTGAILRLARADEEGAAEAMAEAVASANAPRETRDLVAMRDEWEANCARCHGVEGRGDAGGVFPVEMPNFADPDWQASRDDEWLRKVIDGGGTAVGLNAAMPPWGALYDAEEIAHMVTIVREFGE